MSETVSCHVVPSITPHEALQLTSSALFLDVRTPAEFEDSHIQGSISHPIADLNPTQVAKAAQGKTCCIVICGSGGRATRAAQQLLASKLAEVRVLQGGMKAWSSLGLPVIVGKKAVSIERQVRIAAGSLVVLGIILSYVTHPTWILSLP